MRLNRIIENWDEIRPIMQEELPDRQVILDKMVRIGSPMKPSDLNLSLQDALDAFTGSRDVRDKYLTSSMLWDLGELEAYRDILERNLKNQ